MTCNRLFLTLLTALLLTACAGAPQRPTTIKGDGYAFPREYLRWMIHDHLARHDIVGLSIALVDDQTLVWAEGFGYADEKKNVKASPETLYQAGSISKLFTATAVMQLAEQGKLDIDAPVQTYLPRFAMKSRFEGSAPITLRNIMTHHSGLPSDLINGMWGYAPARDRDLIASLREEHVAYPPNTVFAYSNLGYSLLGQVVEAVSGRPFNEQMEQALLKPMGMKEAYFDDTLHNAPRASKGYYMGVEKPIPYLRDIPAGGLHTSVIDLSRFVQMGFAEGRSHGARIIGSKTLAEMQRLQDGSAPFDLNPFMGLAWFIAKPYGEEVGIVAVHDGATPQFNSVLMTIPQHKIAVIMLANSNTAAQSVSAIGEKALRLALESKTGIFIADDPKLKKTRRVPAEDLARATGDWASDFGLIHLQRGRNRMTVTFQGEKLDFVRREDGYYHVQYKLLGLLPVDLGSLEKMAFGFRQHHGREVMTLHSRDGLARLIFAAKVQPQSMSPGWDKYLGRYRCINAQGGFKLRTITLRHADGILKAEFDYKVIPGDKVTQTLALMPVNDNEAVVQGLGRGKGDTLHFASEQDGVYLRYSGFLLRRDK